MFFFYFLAETAKMGLVETKLAIIPGGGQYIILSFLTFLLKFKTSLYHWYNPKGL